MATYQILAWQELPAQIRAQDQNDEINVELPLPFQERIDRIATERGVVGTDDYLLGWKWSEPQERPGTARQVVDALVKELEARFRNA
jgi:hypothetical protein